MTHETQRVDLTGRLIVVTGCSRGLGAALAPALVGAGARVIVHARDEAAAAEAMQKSGAHAAVAGDLADPALGARLMAEVMRVSAGQGLDGLILNAGVLGEMGPLDQVDFARFREVMELNVDAQLRLFVATLPALLSRRGVVIWMSSGVGRFGAPNYGAYLVSKHAIEGLNRLAHAEYGARGLVSLAVAPGMVQTDMLRAALGVDDVNMHTRPEIAAAAFVRLVHKALTHGAEIAGASLDVLDF